MIISMIVVATVLITGVIIGIKLGKSYQSAKIEYLAERKKLEEYDKNKVTLNYNNSTISISRI